MFSNKQKSKLNKILCEIPGSYIFIQDLNRHLRVLHHYTKICFQSFQYDYHKLSIPSFSY